MSDRQVTGNLPLRGRVTASGSCEGECGRDECEQMKFEIYGILGMRTTDGGPLSAKLTFFLAPPPPPSIISQATITMPVWQYVFASIAPIRPVDNCSFRWYKNIAPKTRMIVGVGIMAYAGLGLFLSDRVEEKFGFTPTEQDKEDLQRAMPKIITVEKGDR